MMLTSHKRKWKPRKPSGRAGSPRRCRRFATVTALSAASQCLKRGKSTGLVTVLTALKLLNAV